MCCSNVLSMVILMGFMRWLLKFVCLVCVRLDVCVWFDSVM